MFAALPMGLPKTIVFIVGCNTVVGRLLNFADLVFYNNYSAKVPCVSSLAPEAPCVLL